MNAYDILDLLSRHEASLYVDGDKLRCRAPKGFLTPQLLDDIKRHKEALLEILGGVDGVEEVLAARPDPYAPLALSPSQQQLWVLDQMVPGNPFYNNPAAIDIAGALAPAALARAISGVVGRHEALRTVFGNRDGEPRQVVQPPAPVELPVIDLRDLSAVERARRADALTRADAEAPFDLANGPLLRSCLIRLAEQEFRWLLNVHHIVADGWSIGILIREVAALYRADVLGQDSGLARLSIQYPDYALWQHRRLNAGALERQSAYWTKQLAGAPNLLALPTDRPRPAVPSYRGRCHSATVSAATASRLAVVGESAEATSFMTLLAALSVLLWRYSGQDDVCVGTPFANRNHSELEGLIGHFINTVVIRTRVDPAQSFAALLGEVRQSVLEAQAHPDLPFEQLVEALNPQRHTSYSPLFQVMLVVQNIPRDRLELPGLALRPLATSAGSAKFDLAVEVAELDGGLGLTFEYNTDLFDASTMSRMADHFCHLLEQVAADPRRPVGQLRLLRPDERALQIAEWNATSLVSDTGGSVVERFQMAAARYWAQAAVVGEAEELDYATLRGRANRLAHSLIARGLGRDQIVGLHVKRSVDLAVGILGILAAGAAYLPLDPALPRDRLTAMVADASPALVLTDSDQAEEDWSSLSMVAVEADRDDDPDVRSHPANLAYIIYTSGSTGSPKGVAVSHGGIANLLDNWLATVGAAPGEPAALWSSIGFDVSVQEILLPLTTGGALHLVPEGVRIDPQELMGWLRSRRVVQAYLPPAFITWIDEEPAQRLAGLALRQLLVGVEPLPEQALHRMTQLLPGLRIINGYGPTETTVYSSSYSQLSPIARTCPIGRPLANTRIYVLDEQLEPVPIGVTGEIYIGGAGLARGYLGRPGETAQRFGPDPFAAGQRVYRTGDLARWLRTGDLEFLGRYDQQIKVRGFRVELGEIEAALLGQPGVHEAAVLVDRDDSGEPRLVGCVGRSAPTPLMTSEWRGVLAQRLPGYMIPSHFVELAHLPQTPNGKLDRVALLAHARAGAPAQVNQASPRDHIEMTLYQIWRRLLVYPDISIRDSFFDIGGTSISAIKLAHAIQGAFGEQLPVRDIMLYPSIEALGGRLRRGSSGQSLSNLIEFRPGDGRARVICVHPAGGTAFCYLSLAKSLPVSCGVFGIQSPGLNPGEEVLPTVEAMAQAYLRLVEPHLNGSIVLTGLSYGGLVAYEMGRLLAERGHSELSVVLLDTLGTDDPVHRADIVAVDMAEFRDKLVKFNGMYPGIEDEQVERYFNIYNHNRMTIRDYLAPPAALRLALLQAVPGRSEEFLAEIRQFWRRRAQTGDFELQLADCDHWELLESAEVQNVARLLISEFARFPSHPLSAAESAISSVSLSVTSAGPR